MIRRPPTAIALEHQDVESHLQRIYLRHTLTVDFEQLRLDDESVGDLQMEYTLSPGVSSDHSDGKIDTTEGQAGPSCIGYTLPQDENASTSATPQIRSATKSCLKSPVPSKCRLSLQGTISPGVHPRRADRLVDPQLKVKFALSPQELELHNGNVHLPPEEIGMPTLASLSLGSISVTFQSSL